MTEEDDILAAEHALGLADAQARVDSDPAFAAAVEAWRVRFDPLHGPERAPPPELWDRIAERLPANDPARHWRFATFAASAAAVLLLGLLVLRPGMETPLATPAPQVAAMPAARLMVASLASERGGGSLSVVYDDREGRMTVNPAQMAADGKTPELWVIPPDGKPRSLGVIADKAAATMIVPAPMRPLLAGGVTLAVSLEPQGGSPTGQPTGPVIMSGTMSRV